MGYRLRAFRQVRGVAAAPQGIVRAEPALRAYATNMRAHEEMRRSSWLMSLIDQEGIGSRQALERFLASPDRRKQLREVMGKVPFSAPPPDPDAVAPLAAGAGIDLGSMGACTAPECLIRDADMLVRRTWHYFDRIYIVGPSAHYLAGLFDEDPDRAVNQVFNYSELLFHLRNIGAEAYLSFGEKPPACMQHLSAHAKEAGMGELLDPNPFVVKFSSEAKCVVNFTGKENACGREHWAYTINHPSLEHTHWGTVHASKSTRESEVLRLAFQDAYTYFLAHLVSDTRFARYTKASLGVTASVHDDLQDGRFHAVPSPTDVAFQIPLPFVDEADPKELLRFRAAEWESYDTFHDALRRAIDERLRIHEDHPGDNTDIAIEIANDLIDPALAKLFHKLSLSQRLLAKTASISAGIAAITTTVGVLSSTPLAIGPLVGAAVGVIDYKRYLADQNALQAEDMYFLWRFIRKVGCQHEHP